MKTRLVIFEANEDNRREREVFDIIEWGAQLTLPEIVKLLPRVHRPGEKPSVSRAHWKRVLETLGTKEYPFFIEYSNEP